MRRHTISFKHALAGLAYAFASQPNFRFHLATAAVVSLAGWYFRLPRTDWLILIFTFTWMITVELINTSLEAIVDLVSPQIHPLAKIAKDTAAGLVLFSALGAIAVGLLIFLPRFLSLLNYQ